MCVFYIYNFFSHFFRSTVCNGLMRFSNWDLCFLAQTKLLLLFLEIETKRKILLWKHAHTVRWMDGWVPIWNNLFDKSSTKRLNSFFDTYIFFHVNRNELINLMQYFPIRTHTCNMYVFEICTKKLVSMNFFLCYCQESYYAYTHTLIECKQEKQISRNKNKTNWTKWIQRKRALLQLVFFRLIKSNAKSKFNFS